MQYTQFFILINARKHTYTHPLSLSRTHTHKAAYPHGVVPVCNVFFIARIIYTVLICFEGQLHTQILRVALVYDVMTILFYFCVCIYIQKRIQIFLSWNISFFFLGTVTHFNCMCGPGGRWGSADFFRIYREKINQCVTFIQHVIHENTSLGFCRIHKQVRKVNMNTAYLWTYLHVLRLYNM